LTHEEDASDAEPVWIKPRHAEHSAKLTQSRCGKHGPEESERVSASNSIQVQFKHIIAVDWPSREIEGASRTPI
jgi:hypothetical protein